MITQILALIYKSISICIYHYTPWVRMLLEIIKNFVIAVRRCRYIPSYRVTTDQFRYARAPISIAIFIPSPQVCFVPRTRARSQPGPRYLALISGLDSNPPHASTIDRAFIVSMPSGLEISRPEIFFLGSSEWPPYPNVFHTQSAARALFQLRQNGAAAHRFDVYSAVKMVFSVDHT